MLPSTIDKERTLSYIAQRFIPERNFALSLAEQFLSRRSTIAVLRKRQKVGKYVLERNAERELNRAKTFPRYSAFAKMLRDARTRRKNRRMYKHRCFSIEKEIVLAIGPKSNLKSSKLQLFWPLARSTMDLHLSRKVQRR